jgi:hypothetical protein
LFGHIFKNFANIFKTFAHVLELVLENFHILCTFSKFKNLAQFEQLKFLEKFEIFGKFLQIFKILRHIFKFFGKICWHTLKICNFSEIIAHIKNLKLFGRVQIFSSHLQTSKLFARIFENILLNLWEHFLLKNHYFGAYFQNLLIIFSKL